MALVNKKFQELITFSRSTSGTYVNSSGYITNNDTVTNYLTYSSQFDNANWTKSNTNIQTNLTAYSQTFNTGWGPNNIQAFGSGSIADAIVAPDGTLTADLISNAAAPGVDFHYVAQGINLFQNTTYTLSVYAKAGPVGSGIIWLLGNAAGDIFGFFNLTTGAVGTTTGFISASIQNVGGGWYRCVASFTNTAVTGPQAVGFGLAQVNGTPSWNSVGLAGTQQAYLWGAQLVFGTVPGDYQVTAGTAINVLYPDYNGVRRARKLVTNSGTTTVVAQSMANYVSFYATTEDRVLTVYAKPDGLRYLLIGVHNGGGFTVTAAFDIINGAFVAAGGHPSYGNAINNSITSVGNGWYRCSTVIDAFDTTSKAFYVVGSSTYGGIYNRDCTGDGTSGIYIADAQLVAGSVVTDYADNTTGAAIYAPRFDYDPVTRAAKGLLMEPQRTNLFTYSASFNTQLPWGATTVVPNVTTSPDGTTTGALWVPVVGAINAYLYRTDQPTSAATYTVSLYIKSAGLSEIQMGDFGNPTDNYGSAVFNIVTGTIGTQTNLAAASIQAAGNGWYRCSITRIITSGTSNQIQIVRQKSGQVGDGVNGVYIWGAQLEVGYFATSYIPTVASQVTRSADVFDGRLFSTWYNQPEGTIFVDGIVAAQNGVTNTAIIVGVAQNNNVSRDARFIVGATTVAFNVLGAVDAIYPYKMSGAYKLNDSATSLNGAAATVNTTTVIGTGTSMTVAPSGNYMHVRRITYYPQRLSNAQLQSITA